MNTIIITFDQVMAQLLKLVATTTTPKFVAINGYQNEQGEISNYLINLGVDYGTAKAEDTEKLKDKENFLSIDFGSSALFSDAARMALLDANLKPSRQSIAQTEAYTTVCPNVRLHEGKQRLYIFGFIVSKVVLVEGVYPDTNSALITIAKNKIKKQLRTSKFRQFCLDKITEVRIKGETLEIDL